MNKIANVFGGIATLLLVLALLFKAQQWPNATVLLIASTFFCTLFYLPTKLIRDWLNSHSVLDKVHAITFFLTTSISFIAVIFKIMHWPLAGMFMIISQFLLFVYFIIYFVRRKRTVAYAGFSWHDVYLTVSIFSVFFFISLGNYSRFFYLQFETMETRSLQLTTAYEAANNSLLEFSKFDSTMAVHERAKLEYAHSQSDGLCSYLTEFRCNLVIAVEGGPADICDSMPTVNFGRKGNFDIPKKILIGDPKNTIKTRYSGYDLKMKIREYCSNMDNLLKSDGILNSLAGIGLQTDDFNDDMGENVPWEVHSFGSSMFVVILSDIAFLRSMVRQTEYVTMHALLAKFGDRNQSEENLAQVEVFKAIENFDMQVADLKSKQDLQVLANREKERELEAQTSLIGAVVTGIVFVFVLLILAVRAFVRKRKDHIVLAKQKTEIEEQKLLVEEKNREIIDSISYAKRLQTAILPPENEILAVLPNSFIVYLPKDIVAGDFYWMETVGEEIYIAVADCTGHGVPGAMVSVVCHNALTRTVNEFEIRSPEKILDKVRDLVIATFEKADEQVKDGMDISLILISKDRKMITFSGANNPLWISRNGSILEFDADKQPVGRFEKVKPFSAVEISLSAGDVIYMATDGYSDQFGGEKGKKFKAQALKKLLLDISAGDMSSQKEHVMSAHQAWKGSLEQVDDICIFGVRV